MSRHLAPTGAALRPPKHQHIQSSHQRLSNRTRIKQSSSYCILHSPRKILAVTSYPQEQPYVSTRFTKSGPSTAPVTLRPPPKPQYQRSSRRHFHDYFVTHLPSSSLHPDSRTAAGPRHHLPRSDSKPHAESARTPASMIGIARDTTVVRIPLRSAKHHFGANSARGTRPYNEDAYQAGTIEIPAFAKRAPLSVRPGEKMRDEAPGAQGLSGDPQVFYFGIFDGHGGDVCSAWLKEKLHKYLEDAAEQFEMESSLQNSEGAAKPGRSLSVSRGDFRTTTDLEDGLGDEGGGEAQNDTSASNSNEDGNKGTTGEADPADILQRELIESWSETVGGYFVRFKPEYFSPESGGAGESLNASIVRNNQLETPSVVGAGEGLSLAHGALESILSYSFLKADLDFVTGRNESNKQAGAASTAPAPERHRNTHQDSDSSHAFSSGSNDLDSSVDEPSTPSPQPFIGGSTCSVALISTPTPIPFWHPSTPFTILTAHLGDTRILLCSTATGNAIPLTATHHPSDPSESSRLRRFAAVFTTDSFGEERISGLANTRAFGDRHSKRVGVSAEPQLTLLHAKPAEFSFMVLASDGVTGVLTDEEIVDTVRECRTPAEAALKVSQLAVELGEGEAGDADNATAVVVRMGGWERRDEGGGGSVRSREERGNRRREAGEGRNRRGR